MCKYFIKVSYWLIVVLVLCWSSDAGWAPAVRDTGQNNMSGLLLVHLAQLSQSDAWPLANSHLRLCCRKSSTEYDLISVILWFISIKNKGAGLSLTTNICTAGRGLINVHVKIILWVLLLLLRWCVYFQRSEAWWETSVFNPLCWPTLMQWHFIFPHWNC